MLAEQQQRRHVQLPVLTRPRTRAECAGQPRPCPWVSCQHHLYGSIDHRGHYVIAQPWLEPHELEHSCALDVAENEGVTQEDAAMMAGIHRTDAAKAELKFLALIRSLCE